MGAVTVASDTLNDDAGTLVGRAGDFGGNWVESFNDSATNGEVDAGTSSCRAAGVDNTNAMVYTLGAPSNADYDVDLELQNPHSVALDNGHGIVGRYVDEDNHYGIDAGTTGQLYKVVAGSQTTLGTNFTIAVGDVVRLRMASDTIAADLDTGAGFVEQTSVTDTSHTSKGKPGIWWGNIRFGTQDIDPEAECINYLVTQDGPLTAGFRPIISVMT